MLYYFEKLKEHYLKDNGRLIVHFFDTLLLSISPFFWKILNSLMLTGICYIGSKIICFEKQDNIKLVLITFWALIAMMDISITRQSVYWITGSFNYVYPIFMLLIYWYCLLNISRDNKYFILAILFGFLASASVEQAGLMCVGLTFLILISEIYNLKKFGDALTYFEIILNTI